MFRTNSKLTKILLEIASEDVQVLTDAKVIAGKDLVPHLKKAFDYDSLMNWFRKNRKDPHLIDALVKRGVQKQDLKNEESLKGLLKEVQEKIEVVRHSEIVYDYDEESETYSVSLFCELIQGQLQG